MVSYQISECKKTIVQSKRQKHGLTPSFSRFLEFKIDVTYKDFQ